jgi:hypothetical protein
LFAFAAASAHAVSASDWLAEKVLMAHGTPVIEDGQALQADGTPAH